MARPTILRCDELVLAVTQCDFVHGQIDAVRWCDEGSPDVAALHQILLRREPKTWHLLDGETGERVAFAGYLTRLRIPPRDAKPSALIEVQVSVTPTGPIWRDDDTEIPHINVRDPMWDPVNKEYV